MSVDVSDDWKLKTTPVVKLKIPDEMFVPCFLRLVLFSRGIYKVRSAKVRNRNTYKVRNKMRTGLRILYVTTYKLRNQKCEM